LLAPEGTWALRDLWLGGQRQYWRDLRATWGRTGPGAPYAGRDRWRRAGCKV